MCKKNWFPIILNPWGMFFGRIFNYCHYLWLIDFELLLYPIWYSEEMSFLRVRKLFFFCVIQFYSGYLYLWTDFKYQMDPGTVHPNEGSEWNFHSESLPMCIFSSLMKFWNFKQICAPWIGNRKFPKPWDFFCEKIHFCCHMLWLVLVLRLSHTLQQFCNLWIYVYEYIGPYL